MSTSAASGAARTRSAAALAALAIACSRQPNRDELRDLSSPSAATRPRTPEAVSRYDLAAGSFVEFTVGPRQRRLRGSVMVAEGHVLLDPDHVSGTRGSVSFDLLTLRIEAAIPVKEGSTSARSLTEQSLEWLEIGSAEALAARPELRFARFTLRDVYPRSHGAPVPRRARSSNSDGRALRLHATGDLELHGFRVPYTMALNVTLHPDRGPTPRRVPERLEIATAEPGRLNLSAHDVVPRGAHGEVLSELLTEFRRAGDDAVTWKARWMASWAGQPAEASP